eukprot:gene4831-8678_t
MSISLSCHPSLPHLVNLVMPLKIFMFFLLEGPRRTPKDLAVNFCRAVAKVLTQPKQCFGACLHRHRQDTILTSASLCGFASVVHSNTQQQLEQLDGFEQHEHNAHVVRRNDDPCAPARYTKTHLTTAIIATIFTTLIFIMFLAVGVKYAFRIKLTMHPRSFALTEKDRDLLQEM